jgi:geranylgeranyl diphosphate synthase type II
MQIPILTLPRPVPEQKMRPPQDTIPQSREERDAIKRLCEVYVETDKPVPPLSLEELRKHSQN